MGERGGPRTFADRLEYLFRTVHPEGRRPYSLEEVASGIAAQGYEAVSAAYIWALRRGQRDNPSLKTVQALARFFGVPTAYFFEDEPAETPGARPIVAAAANELAGRTTGCPGGGLSPEARVAVDAIVQLTSEAVAKIVAVVAELDQSRPQPPSPVGARSEEAGFAAVPQGRD